MKYLLDTCIVSSLRKPKEAPSLVEWISSVDELELYLSVVTLGELEKGVSRLPESAKKSAVSQWLRQDVVQRFGDRILPIDASVASRWGDLLGTLEKKGRPLPLLDAFIAATALVSGCTIVTRNAKDFIDCGVPILNP